MPSAPGGSNFTVQAEDSSGQFASRSYLVIVAPAQPQSASPRGQSATYVYTGSVSQTYSYKLSNGGDSRYITGCSVSGAGVTTAITTYPGTVNFDIVYTAASTAQTGSRSVTCSWVYSDGSQRFSLTITGDTLHVYDAAPVITLTQLLSPLYPGGQAYVAIYGTGFGPAQGGIAVCRTGATPCGNSDVAGTVVYWNHGVSYDQVNVLLAAGSTASGAYDVQLTSRGSTGSGFLQNPNGPDPPQASGQIAVTPTITIQVESVKQTQTNNAFVLLGVNQNTTNLTANGSAPGGTYQWQVGPGLGFQGPSTGQNVSIVGTSPSTSGMDTYVSVTYSVAGASVSASIRVTVRVPTQFIAANFPGGAAWTSTMTGTYTGISQRLRTTSTTRTRWATFRSRFRALQPWKSCRP